LPESDDSQSANARLGFCSRKKRSRSVSKRDLSATSMVSNSGVFDEVLRVDMKVESEQKAPLMRGFDVVLVLLTDQPPPGMLATIRSEALSSSICNHGRNHATAL